MPKDAGSADPAPAPQAAEQQLWAGGSVIVGLAIGFALHRLIAVISLHAGAGNPGIVASALGPTALGLIAVPLGQVALGRRGLWLAAVLWPVAIVVGCVVILGLPSAP